MVKMFCRNRVEDFDRWKRVFDSHSQDHRAAGLHLESVWREIGRPTHVFFVFAADDIRRAQEFIDDPISARAGEQAGVLEGEYYFLEALGSD